MTERDYEQPEAAYFGPKRPPATIPSVTYQRTAKYADVATQMRSYNYVKQQTGINRP